MGKGEGPRTILIAGPTASGKSALALDLAARIGGRIINADSMQVYAEFRILTARPSVEDEARAPHRLYGFRPAAQPYSAAAWGRDALAQIRAAHVAGEAAIVVGGTGLYFRVLTHGLAAVPAVPPEIRAALTRRLERDGLPGLHAELRERDPPLAARLEPGDAQRIVRGLEVVLATGRPLSAWQAQPPSPPPDLGPVTRLVLVPPRPRQIANIESRFDAMLARGALDEVRAVAGLNLDPALPAAKVLGLRPLADHLAGRLTLERARELAVIETRRYAKRQGTWIRNQLSDWTFGSMAELREISI